MCSKEQIKAIKNPAIIKNLPNTLLQHVHGDFVPSIPKDKKQWVNSRQIAEITDESLIGKLDAEWIPWIASEMVKHCSNQFVCRLTEEQQDFITEEQVPYLRGEQIARIDKERLFAHLKAVDDADKGFVNQMPQISDEQLRWVTEEMVQGLSNQQLLRLQRLQPNLLQYITKMQAQSFDSQELFDLLNAQQVAQWMTLGQVKYIEEDKIGLVAQEKLQYLENEKAIRAISFWNVQHLTREQLKKRSRGQFFTYVLGVITLGVVMSIVSFLAHVTLVTLAVWLINREKGKRFMAALHSHPIRLHRLFATYLATK